MVDLDVNSDESVRTGFKTIADSALFVQNGSRIDLLINNAGYSQPGTVEMLSMEQVQQQFNTNVFGVIRCQQAVLPFMRKQKSGKILNISSVGGIYATAFNDVYCAAKFALTGLTDSQSAMFRTFGVHVTNVEPGAMRTDFMANSSKANAGAAEKLPSIPEYIEPIKQVRAAFGKNSATPAV